MPPIDKPSGSLLALATSLALATALGGNLLGEINSPTVVRESLAGEVSPWRAWLADWAYVQADVYFLRGSVSGLFTRTFQPETSAPCEPLADGTHAPGEAPARDWMEAFGRSFHAHRHTHMGDSAVDGAMSGQARELLPWLRLAVELNPHHTEAWLLGAHLLRRNLNRDAEAERFLSAALRHNPGHHEIHFALGQLMEEHHRDATRTRTHWQRALHDWHRRGPERTDLLVGRRILGSLARLEEREGRFAVALNYVEQLATSDPHSKAIREWIIALRRNLSPSETTADGQPQTNETCAHPLQSDLIAPP